MWIKIQNQKYFNHFFHATWLQHYKNKTMETPYNSSIFWPENIEDIKNSDCVVCYADQVDVLGGALIECGVALAKGIPICLVGENEAYRSWTHHPLVTKLSSIDSAIMWLDAYDEQCGKQLEK